MLRGLKSVQLVLLKEAKCGRKTNFGVFEPRTYLCHEPVGAGALLVAENNLRIVVGLELGESGVLARNFALGQAAGPQRVLGHVGDVLHEDQRGEFPRRLVAVAAPAGPTSPQGARAQQQQQHAQANTDTHSITDHSSGRLRRPPAAAGAGAERRVEGDAPPPTRGPAARALNLARLCLCCALRSLSCMRAATPSFKKCTHRLIRLFIYIFF